LTRYSNGADGRVILNDIGLGLSGTGSNRG
jgi:hypothetical protein